MSSSKYKPKDGGERRHDSSDDCLCSGLQVFSWLHISVVGLQTEAGVRKLRQETETDTSTPAMIRKFESFQPELVLLSVPLHVGVNYGCVLLQLWQCSRVGTSLQTRHLKL